LCHSSGGESVLKEFADPKKVGFIAGVEVVEEKGEAGNQKGVVGVLGDPISGYQHPALVFQKKGVLSFEV